MTPHICFNKPKVEKTQIFHRRVTCLRIEFIRQVLNIHVPLLSVLVSLFQLYPCYYYYFLFFYLAFRLQFGLKSIRNIINHSLDVVSSFRNNMNKCEDVLEGGLFFCDISLISLAVCVKRNRTQGFSVFMTPIPSVLVKVGP